MRMSMYHSVIWSQNEVSKQPSSNASNSFYRHINNIEPRKGHASALWDSNNTTENVAERFGAIVAGLTTFCQIQRRVAKSNVWKKIGEASSGIAYTLLEKIGEMVKNQELFY